MCLFCGRSFSLEETTSLKAALLQRSANMDTSHHDPDMERRGMYILLYKYFFFSFFLKKTIVCCIMRASCVKEKYALFFCYNILRTLFSLGGRSDKLKGYAIARYTILYLAIA